MKDIKQNAMLLVGLGLISGIAGAIAIQTHAADATIESAAVAPTAAVTSQTGDTDTAANATTGAATTAKPATPDAKTKGHAPLGGDGAVTAIDGTTITMQEEADEGGAIYTVNAGNATITNNGAAADLSALKVGDKIFVQGTTSGTNVTATSISLGRFGCKGQKSGSALAPTVN
jgi:hypothetical protein